MQNGGEEVGTQGGYGRRLPNGLAFSEEARRAERGAQEKPTLAGRIGQSTSVLEQTHGRAGAGEAASEKVREINGRRYAYVQPDAADYAESVRTAADYAKHRYGLDVDVSDGPSYVDGREYNDLMFTK